MKKSLYSPQAQLLRRWLKEQRLAAGLTMREVAKLLDVPFQLVSKIEKGERRLDVVEFVLYCQALRIDPHEGIGLIEDNMSS